MILLWKVSSLGGAQMPRVNGAAVTVDATALSSDYLSMDYVTQDKTAPSALIVPAHSLTVHGGSIVYFTVTNDGTDRLRFDIGGRALGTWHEFTTDQRPVGYDRRALRLGSYVNLNYKAYDPSSPSRSSAATGPALPLRVGDVYYFTLTDDGLIDYDPALEGIFFGRGTNRLRFAG